MAVIDEILREEKIADKPIDEFVDTGVGMLDDLLKEPSAESQAASQSLSITSDLDYDAEAKVYDLTKRSGLPAPTVRQNPKQVDKNLGYPVYTIENPEFIQGYLGKSLVPGQPNSAISGDDVPGLEKVQVSLSEKLARAYTQGVENVELGNLRSQQLFGDVSEATERRIQEIKGARGKEARQKISDIIAAKEERFPTTEELRFAEPADRLRFTPVGTIEKALAGTAEQLPILGTTLGQGAYRALQGGVLGTVAAVATRNPALSRGGAELGFKFGSAEAIFKLEAGLAADEFMDFRDEDGQPLDPGIIWAASIAVGGINAGLEFFSLGKLAQTMSGVPGIGGVVKKLTTKKALEILKDKTKKQALLEVFKKFGKAVTFEAITEAAQEAFTILGGEISKEVSGKRFERVSLEAGAERAFEAGKAAIGPTVILGGPGSIIGVRQALNNTDTSNDFHDNMDKDHKAVSETKTQERSPDHMKEVLGEMGKDEDVYISVEGIDGIFQSQAPGEANILLEEMGVDPVKARASITTGEDIIVKANNILTLSSESYNKIKDDIKEAPGAYTRREINEQQATEDTENATQHVREDIELTGKIDTEVNRLSEELKKVKLPDPRLAEDAPVLLKGLAERLQLEGLDPAERLKNISFKRTPLKDFVQKAKGKVKGVFQPQRVIPQSFKPATIKGEKFFGKLEDVKQLPNKIFKPLNQTEKQTVESRIQNSGLSRIEWAKTIDLAEPIDATLFSDGEIIIQDGHHRWTAATILDKNLNVDLQVTNFKSTKEALTKFFNQESFFQAEKAAPEGAIGVPRGHLGIEGQKKVVELFEDADLSTALHEVGHIALLEYAGLERSGEASQELINDMKALREWAGVKEGVEFSREQSEQVARGFEAYLREGKAPTPALRAAFERLKHYLMSVYKSALELDVTLTDDVRGVFGRMISTNIEVEAAAQAEGFVVKTDKEMDALGMVTADMTFAKKLIEIVKKKAEKLLLKDRNKNLNEKRGKWTREAESEIFHENPVYNIWDDMEQTGKLLDRNDLIARGYTDIDALPHKKLLQTKAREKKSITVKVRKLRKGNLMVELTPEAIEDLKTVRKLIDEGEKGQQIFKETETVGEGTGADVIAEASTFPKWFQDRELNKKDSIEWINRILQKRADGVTPQMWETVKSFIEGHREEVSREISAGQFEAGIDPNVAFEFGANLVDVAIDKDLIVKPIPSKPIVKKDGTLLDAIAAFYNFVSVDAMMAEFIATPNYAVAVKQRVIEKQAEHDSQYRVEDYFGDIKQYRDYQALVARYLSDKTVDEAAISKSIQNNIKRWERDAAFEVNAEQPDLSGDALDLAIADLVEEKVAAFRVRKSRARTLTTDALKRLAKETMNAKTVREARRSDKFLAAMKKASNDERRAIMRKDWGAASEANELVRFNYEMASLSSKANAEVDTILERSKRIGKSKTIEFKQQEAILHLISDYKLANLAPSEPLQKPNYTSLFAGDEFGHNGFPEPEFLQLPFEDYRDLRLEQLRELDNAIRYLEGQGRINKKGLLSDGETLVQDVVDESVEVQETVKEKKTYQEGSMMRKLTDVTRKFFASLDSLTYTAIGLDGYSNLGKDGVKGPFELMVIDPIKAGLNKITGQGRDIDAKLKPHIDQISKTMRKWQKQYGSRINIDGIPVPFLLQEAGYTRGWRFGQIFSVVLNTGNTGDKSNYANLKAGYTDLTDTQIEKIKTLLTVEDMKAVQGIWDVINSLFSQADTQFLKDNNYHMPKVEATPFVFKGTRFKGGYYPIKHDRNLSFKVTDRGLVEDFFNNDAGEINVPYTKKNFSIARVNNVALPILLDMSVISAHLSDTLRYIHLTDSIKDADKITRNHGFRESATRILGKDVYNSIRPALQHVANPKMAGLDVAGAQGVEWLRGLSTMYILAWNTGVALKQPFSTFGAINDIGKRAYINGFFSTIRSPKAHYDKMTELSPYMFDRLKGFDRELKSAFLTLTKEQKGVYFGDTKVTWQDVKNFGFWQIRLADTAAVLPIWHGAFNDKLLPDQSNLQEAINYADDKVRNSQPSAQPLDLSAWQRDAGALRLFSQFQTFTVGKYGQRQRLYYRAWQSKKISTVDYAWFNFMDAMLPLVSMNFLFSVIQGTDLGDDDERNEFIRDILLGWAFMGVPLIGSITRSLSAYGDPLDSPVLQTGNKLVRSVWAGLSTLDGFENKKERDKALWGIAHALSILSGVPMDKIYKKAIKGSEQKDGVPGVKYLVPAHK